jgi:hypothetical protein
MAKSLTEQMSHLFRGSYSMLFYKMHINTKKLLVYNVLLPDYTLTFYPFQPKLQNKTKHNSLQ